MLRAGLILAIFISLSISCKDRKEGNPVASFELITDSIAEGSTLSLIQKSENASSFEWNVLELGIKSTENQPSFYIDLAGTFTLQLTAKGGNGITSTLSSTFKVTKDTLWRFCNRESKEWSIKSIINNGTELINDDCQVDDIFKLEHIINKQDSFFYDEGNVTCPAGTYPFTMPTKGDWTLDYVNSTISLELNVLGVATQYVFDIIAIRKDYFEGIDNANNTSILMIEK